MKSVPTSFRTHLDGDVTALCTCWKITRRDGVKLLFTDADQDVTRDGEIYKSNGAYSRSAIESTSSLSVDNLEVIGMATELSLPVEELRAGAYDHAEVLVFMTAWMQSVDGKIKLRRGFFGEVTVLPNGTFTVELRGLMQRLSHTYNHVYSATCRHDLGDSGCKIVIDHPFTNRGANIPLPLKDSDFEEVGVAGLGSSHVWYNPLNDEELVNAGTTYSGTYAAHGAETGGRLQQDMSILSMGDDFISNVDSGQVDINLFGWRRDDGDKGRIRMWFMDHDHRQLRSSCGYLALAVGTTIPELSVAGDWTVEFWAMFNDTENGETTLFGNNSSGSVPSKHLYTTAAGQLRYRSESLSGQEFFGIPFNPEREVWTHIALTKTNGITRLYVDAVLRHEEEDVFMDDLQIDAIGTGYGSSLLSGGIDEFRVWSHARTQAEISEERFRDIVSPTAGLVRYYPFDGDKEDYGVSPTAPLTGGTLSTGFTPVAVSYRGTDASTGTGFQDVGEAWSLESMEDVSVPPHTRTVRIIFDHENGVGTPEGTRLDGLFGWFWDNANTMEMPNFTVGSDDTVWSRAGMVTTGGSNRIFNVIVDEPRAVNSGWFQGGLVTFYSGKNKGRSMEVKRWTSASNQVELFLSLPYPVQQGDLFTVYPGCDKTRIGCRVLFDNVINFFGTPDVPGEDELYRYPDAK